MKKSKLLAPVLVGTALSSVAPIITLASCSKTAANITLADDTEKTTSANVTTQTFSFNVANYDETSDEIETEIVDEKSEQNVQVEIVNTYYDVETKKLTVIVNISKEEGSLNESEEVSFSINFKCVKKETKVQKWLHKIEKFRIKHHIGEEDQHFSDLDTEKIISVEKGTKAKATAKLTFTPNDSWVKSGETPTEEQFIPSNLHVYAVPHFDHHHFSGIKLEYETTTSFNDSGDLEVSINYDTTYAADEGDFLKFGLLFSYYEEKSETREEQAFQQVVGGFGVKYNIDFETPHLAILHSRERHYYKTINDNTQTGLNYLGFALLESTDYTPEDFKVSSTSEYIEFKDCEILTHETVNYLIVPYTVKKQSESPYAQEPHLFNIDITIESTNEENPWKKTIKGFNIINVAQSALVNYDKAEFAKVSFKAAGKTTLKNCITTISPILAQDLWTTYVSIDGVQTGNATLTANHFSYIGTEFELDTTNAGINKGDVKDVTYMLYLVTDFTVFKYTLTLSTTFSE